jgi:hypothetical protein
MMGTVSAAKGTGEFRFSECLFAKIFRDADAANIGCARFCYGDFAMARY